MLDDVHPDTWIALVKDLFAGDIVAPVHNSFNAVQFALGQRREDGGSLQQGARFLLKAGGFEEVTP